jgi:resolvase-like protein
MLSKIDKLAAFPLAFVCGIASATKEAAMRVYGYCRVSTTEQASGGLSLDTQRQQITGYGMMKGWTVADFFVEGGVSGSGTLMTVHTPTKKAPGDAGAFLSLN